MSNVFEGLSTSDKIRGILASRKKTQAELATLMGVTEATVSARMKENKWDVKELAVIATAYGVELTDLI